MKTVPLTAKTIPCDEDTFTDVCRDCVEPIAIEEYTIGRLGGFGRCYACQMVYPIESLARVNLDSLRKQLHPSDGSPNEQG